jgi:hypothetical protein
MENGHTNAATPADASPFGPIISSYTHADAIADGTLIDVTVTAREAGIRWPVALTAAAHARYVTVPDGVTCQDEAGRLWDVVYMLAVALRAEARRGDGQRTASSSLTICLHVRNDNREGMPPLVRLKAVVGPTGPEDGSPCLTVMLPDED